MKKLFRHKESRHGRPARIRDSRGMALVLTLMIVAIITAMVVEFAYGVYTSTASLSNWETSQQLSLAARSAVKLAARLVAENGQKKGTNGTFVISQQIPFGDLNTTVTLTIEDSDAKFNLNSIVTTNGQLDKGVGNVPGRYIQFKNLLNALNLPTSIAARVADWIDPDRVPILPLSPDSETGAKNAYLDSVDELLLIPGIDRKTYERLLPYVTIYGSGYSQGAYVQGMINVNDAGLPVLMSIPGVNKDGAERLIEYRKNTPFTPNTTGSVCGPLGLQGDACRNVTTFITAGRSVFHVTATAESGGIRRTIDSVLRVTGTSATVMYWKET